MKPNRIQECCFHVGLNYPFQSGCQIYLFGNIKSVELGFVKLVSWQESEVKKNKCVGNGFSLNLRCLDTVF